MNTLYRAVHEVISMHMLTEKYSLALLCSPVLQYESRESFSTRMVPEGTNEEEFCFSFESLKGLEKILGDV